MSLFSITSSAHKCCDNMNSHANVVTILTCKFSDKDALFVILRFEMNLQKMFQARTKDIVYFLQ